MKPAPRSLKGRALQLLAQRDQSRVELRRKLLRHAQKDAVRAQLDRAEGNVGDGGVGGDSGFGGVGTGSGAGGADCDARGDNRGESVDPASQVDALLDWLEAHRFLSSERFVESRVHAREGRFGNLRIRAELAQHGVALSADAARALAESELERAGAVRDRKFARAPGDAAEQAAQSRFLAARGFSPEVIHRVMRRVGRASDDDRTGRVGDDRPEECGLRSRG